MYDKELPLTIDNKNLYLNMDRLQNKIEELELFFQYNKYMNSKKFSRNVLFSQEIKSNNTIEGYNDDIGLVYNILNRNLKIADKNKEQRIKNLYNAYKFISRKNTIDKYSLRDLYSILSKNLLSGEDLRNMGEFYRKNPVYIYFSDNVGVEPDMGVNADDIDKYMNDFFSYINSDNDLNCKTDYFIKSQIIHFQLVYIHPFYDINGRTSRTVSMWYLLNNKAYPFIIFNRGISFNKQKYYKYIRLVKNNHNITGFINYMLDTVKLELEKEYIMEMIRSHSEHFTAVDYQTIYYILSMNGLLTLKDFATFYNNHNDKKTIQDIYDNMVEPLLDKKVIIKTKDTNSNFNSNEKNFIFELNKSKYEKDPNKIKRLKLR